MTSPKLPPAALALIGLLALAAFPPAAQAARTSAPPVPTDTLHVTLEQAIARALEAGTGMQMARASVGVAEGRVKEALAEALPQITGTASYNRKFDSIFRGLDSSGDSTTKALSSLFANSPFGAVHGWTLDLTATQLLWSAGRVGAGLAAARAGRHSVAFDRDQAAADVMLATREAYWNVLYTRDVVAIAQHGLEQAREHLHTVELYRKQGARSEYDLLQAQVDAANQEPPVAVSRSASELALLNLKRLLALPLGQPLALDSPLAFEGGQLPVPSDVADDASARPALQSAEAVVQARRALLHVEQSGRWPELKASATVSHQAFPPDGTPVRDQFHRSVDATLKLEWPLFQGFRTFGGVQRATNELRQAIAQRDDERRAAEMELAQARLGVDEALATLTARRGTARLAERAHQLAEVRWKNGLSTQLEVSDARLQMQNAQVNGVLALKQYRLALAALERAAGHPVATTMKNFDDLSYIPQPNEER